MPEKLRLSELTREQIIQVRDFYSAGMRITDIERICNIATQTVYDCLDGGPVQPDGKRMLEPVPRRRTRSARTWPAGAKAHRVRRDKLVRLFWQAAETQVSGIESRADLKIEPAERERDARTMAVLAKTLRDLDEFDATRAKRTKRGSQHETDPETNYDDPRQIDDFRRELARRIAALAGVDDPEAAG